MVDYHHNGSAMGTFVRILLTTAATCMLACCGNRDNTSDKADTATDSANNATSATSNRDDTSRFVVVNDFAPDIRVELRYQGSHNFVGRPIDGYQQPVAILTREAATALRRVNDSLMRRGYALKIYDAYRPLRAVKDFIRWSQRPDDTLGKAEFYPNVPKSELFAQGYLSSRSKHCHGSTVDLTIVSLGDGRPIDMGSDFDHLDLSSHYDYADITPAQRANRKLLRDIMVWGGFKPIAYEWWHFRLRDEPYSNSFDFPVNRDSLP